MPHISVIIPSRTQEQQAAFLRRSVGSIRGQVGIGDHELSILVAVDAGEALASDLCGELGIECVESERRSQAAALNAGIRRAKGDYVAFLEDDDRWQPHYLRCAMEVAQRFDFISSNQMEIDEHGNILRILDFPTPSGWFMPLATLRRIGEFDESYRWHLDNDWLGRLNRAGLRRFHMVDRHVPVDPAHCRRERIDAFLVARGTTPVSELGRHRFPFPLVQRFVHSGSGMAQIGQNAAHKSRSREEYARLKREYGRIPT